MLGETMPGSGILTIREWREALAAKAAPPGITPPQVADALSGWAETTLALVGELQSRQGGDKELRLTLADDQAQACLGLYYAEKIRGACDLALYDLRPDPGTKASAVGHLEQALAHWRRYAAAVKAHYVPQLLNRIGNSDPEALTPGVAADIALARSWEPGTLGPAPHARAAPDTAFRP